MNSDTDKARLRHKVLTDPVTLLAFGLGAGLAPVAPGTFGSLFGLVIAWWTLPLGLAWRIAVAIGLVLSGLWICGVAARRTGVHDHPGIVWDEIAGMYLVLLFAPPGLFAWGLGFGLFRLFDIWKPWPIRDLDHRLGGGPGIMLDDLVAALYAAVLLVVTQWLIS